MASGVLGKHTLNGVAGLCREVRNRRTGNTMQLYNVEQAGWRMPGFVWAVVCEKHDTSKASKRLVGALNDFFGPDDWCSGCRYQIQQRKQDDRTQAAS